VWRIAVELSVAPVLLRIGVVLRSLSQAGSRGSRPFDHFDHLGAARTG